MHSRFLVILIGCNYVSPMVVIGDMNRIVAMLSEESKNNSYLYAIYTHNEKLDIFIPYKTISKGNVLDFFGRNVRGVIYRA